MLLELIRLIKQIEPEERDQLDELTRGIMEGYSEPGAIYFSIGSQTSFAKIFPHEINGSPKIVTGSYFGPPPYKTIEGKLSQLAREFHAAEHQVYNCFQRKIRHLKANSSIRLISKFIPRLEEIEKTEAFSLYCGTTILLSSGMLLFMASLPNLLKFHNKDFLFMSLWMLLSILITTVISAKIQNKYFLTHPKPYQLQIALIALKEALKNANHTNEFTSTIRVLSQNPDISNGSNSTDLGL